MKTTGNKYKKIVEDIKKDIENGKYNENKLIPTEQALCEIYSVSRITVQRAMRDLIEEGIITRTAGKGTFVNEKVPTASNNITYVHLILPNRNPEFFDLIDNVERIVSEKRQMLSLHIIKNATIENSQEKFEKEIRDIIDISPGAIICYPPCSKISYETANLIKSSNIPFVLLDNDFDTFHFDCVISDNYGGMYELTQYVIDKGHRNISYFSCNHKLGKSIIERQKAFEDCMIVNNIVPRHEKVFEKYSEVYNYTKQLLSNDSEVRAIICANQLIADFILEAVNELNISIPEDVSICSFDGYKETMAKQPWLTAMSQNTAKIGEIGAALATGRMITLKNADIKRKYIVPTILLDNISVKKIN